MHDRAHSSPVKRGLVMKRAHVIINDTMMIILIINIDTIIVSQPDPDSYLRDDLIRQ